MTSPTPAQAALDEDAIQRPRPRWLLLAPVLAILLVQAAFQLLTAWTTFRLFGRVGRAPEIATTVALLNLVATVGLVSGRRFGWIMAMSLSGLNVGYYLWLWWIGVPFFLGMALAALVVFLLGTREMRQAYRADST
ncbi:MAG TPA: hypothetical protein VFQ46_12180 [Candidatus Limnocylindria bacterium]|nr:hypothetical protein [Candidatus Limnocylindria bacterium]